LAFLFIAPTGSKLWRMAYRFGGKQKVLALGAYPAITLADARAKRDAAKAAARTFGQWADEWDRLVATANCVCLVFDRLSRLAGRRPAFLRADMPSPA
jgi:hypothetical protein